MRRIQTCALVLFALFMLMHSARALNSDLEQQATLEADDFSLDLASGARTYRGNVVFRQGSIRLDCDTLAAHYDEHGELQKGVCSGSPGRFKQRPQDSDEDLLGNARSIIFDARVNQIILEGEAEVMQFGNHLRGARITYDLKEKTVRVGGAASGSRARLTIPPRADD